MIYVSVVRFHIFAKINPTNFSPFHILSIESERKNSNLFCFSLVFCYRHDEGINVTERQESSQNHHHSRISNNNLRSPESNIRIGGTYRKKKPAPLPPTKKESCLSDQPSMSKVECNFKYIYNIHTYIHTYNFCTIRQTCEK